MGIIMRAESNPCQGLSPCLLTIQRKLSCLFWGHEVEGGLCLTHRCADREAVWTVRIFCAAEPPHMEEIEGLHAEVDTTLQQGRGWRRHEAESII